MGDVEITLRHDFCRASVMQLAIFMEERLRVNEGKGGWADSPVAWLEERARDELLELEGAIDAYQDLAPENRSVGEAEGIWREAADAANFAMMMADSGTGYFEQQGHVWKPEHRGSRMEEGFAR